MTKRGTNLLVLYLLTGLSVSFFFYRYITPEKLPQYWLSAEMISTGLNVSTEKDKINFQSEPDFVVFASFNGGPLKEFQQSVSLNEISSGEEQIKVKTSYRWKPPVLNLPKATAIRFFSVNKQKYQRSEWHYYTSIEFPHQLPVVSIHIDPDNFFGFTNGIYVSGISATDKRPFRLREAWWDKPANYHKRGNEWEPHAFFQYMENNKIKFETECKISVHGNATRAYPQKSLRLTAVDKNDFEYSFFEGVSQKKFHSIILRNSGNDWDRTMFSDGLMHTLLSGSNLDVMADKTCVVYINGQYWGIHNLRERIDNDHIALKYQVKKKDITIIEDGVLKSGKEKDFNEYKELVAFCRQNNLSSSENYQFVADKINIGNFIDYMIAEIYFTNTDWPANNVKCYKINSDSVHEQKRKWNYILWDMDYGYGYTGNDAYQTDMFEIIKNSDRDVAQLFTSLQKNDNFVNEFLSRLETLLDHELSGKNQLQHIDNYYSRYYDEMNNHIKRWRKPASLQKWINNVNILREFAQHREDFLRKQTEKNLRR